jgi:WXG100 family type VII secretion target
MADINVDYDQLLRSAERLKTGRGSLNDKLTQLKGQIDSLITTNFKTVQASGKLGDAQSRFTEAAKRSIEALDAMGEYLRGVKESHESMDNEAAGLFNNAGPRG